MLARLVAGALAAVLVLSVPFGTIHAQGNQPAYARVASVATPTSSSTQAWTDRQIAVAVFEQLSSTVLIYLIDRQTGQVRQVVLPDSYIVYSLKFDVADPDILWAATSRSAQVFRIDTRTLRFETVAKFDSLKFIFGMDQAPSGRVYVGTFPDARLYSIERDADGWRVSEVPVPRELIGERTNVKDIVANSTGQIFFHLGSPGRLIGYDEATGRSSSIIDTTDSFLFPVRDFPPAVEPVVDASGLMPRPLVARAPDDNRPLPDWALRFLPKQQFEITETGMEIHVAHNERTTTLSALPREGGMPIVAISPVGNDLLLGSTYWNRWAFEFDMRTERTRSLGVIGRTGEFFTACGNGRTAFVPHYLGLLLSYDPTKPLDAPELIPPGVDPTTVSLDPNDNPKEVLALPSGHLGLSCTVSNDALYYAMLPNYSQQAGLLVRVQNGAITNLVTPSQTIGRLAFVRGQGASSRPRLYALTADFVGLGLTRGPESAPMRLIELDPATLAEARSVTLPVQRYRNAVGLVDVGNGKLVAGAEGGGLFLIDTNGPEITQRRVGKTCVGASSLALWRPGFVVAVCSDQLFVLSIASEGLTKVTDLPPASAFIAAGTNGNVYSSARSEIFRTPAAAIEPAARTAARTPGGGEFLADSSLEVYPATNAETRGQTAWISTKLPVDALNGGSWLAVDFGVGRTIAARELEVNWVLPFNTPAVVLVESSMDGVTWTPAGTFESAPQPSEAPYWAQTARFNDEGRRARFWRISPASGLRDQMAVEFLEFRE